MILELALAVVPVEWRKFHGDTFSAATIWSVNATIFVQREEMAAGAQTQRGIGNQQRGEL